MCKVFVRLGFVFSFSVFVSACESGPSASKFDSDLEPSPTKAAQESFIGVRTGNGVNVLSSVSLLVNDESLVDVLQVMVSYEDRISCETELSGQLRDLEEYDLVFEILIRDPQFPKTLIVFRDEVFWKEVRLPTADVYCQVTAYRNDTLVDQRSSQVFVFNQEIYTVGDHVQPLNPRPSDQYDISGFETNFDSGR